MSGVAPMESDTIKEVKRRLKEIERQKEQLTKELETLNQEILDEECKQTNGTNDVIRLLGILLGTLLHCILCLPIQWKKLISLSWIGRFRVTAFLSMQISVSLIGMYVLRPCDTARQISNFISPLWVYDSL
jgi:hypothetical protein